MLNFCDFVPKYELVSRETSFAREVEKTDAFEQAVARAGEFIKQPGIKVLQIETVVLPNMWDEEGSQDVALRVQETRGEKYSRWHQFIRVWYDNEPPPPSPYR